MNVPGPVKLVITHMIDHVNTRLILQLIKGISRFLQKLLRHFSEVTISTSLPLLAAGVLTTIFALN